MNNLPFNPGTQRYVSHATYRRNGAEVLTPIWLAQEGEHYYLFIEGKAFKVKRIRANPKAKIAPCDLRGQLKGPWLDVTGRIVDEPELKARAYKALLKKYGWQMGLLNFFSGLSGKKEKRALIELRITNI